MACSFPVATYSSRSSEAIFSCMCSLNRKKPFPYPALIHLYALAPKTSRAEASKSNFSVPQYWVPSAKRSSSGYSFFKLLKKTEIYFDPVDILDNTKSENIRFFTVQPLQQYFAQDVHQFLHNTSQIRWIPLPSSPKDNHYAVKAPF